MSLDKPIAAFGIPNMWMREMVLSVAPDDFDVRFFSYDDNAAIERLLPQADFLMTWILPSKWIPLLKRCRLVQHQGVGFDKIDVDGLQKSGIPFATTPEGTVIGVAEHTILFILALSKRLIQVHESMKEGRYDSAVWRPECHFLYGRTLGIIGFGRIGRQTAQLALGFKPRIIYYDVIRQPRSIEKQLNATFVLLEELLKSSDIVTLHIPLTPQTKNFMQMAEFEQMRRGAFFINTSRGETYNMDALYESLSSGHLGGAGLDVFNPEPPPQDHPILKLPNVICTPHMATGTVESHKMKARAQFDNFRRVLRGEEPINLLKPQATTLIS